MTKLSVAEVGAEVTVKPAVGGLGIAISQKFVEIPDSYTVTCTCTDGGKAYSTTTTCAGGNNTCDCSTPTSPRVICG